MRLSKKGVQYKAKLEGIENKRVSYYGPKRKTMQELKQKFTFYFKLYS
jgi:hypothetical protein